MATAIGRDDVQRLVERDGATLAEVLPRDEYDWAHLAGAIHLPLKGWDVEEVRRRLDPHRPVIAYCNDFQ